MLRLLSLISTASPVVGCAAGTPPAIRDAPTPNPTIAEALGDPVKRIGERVLWGGSILAVRNRERDTEIEILARLLDAYGEPDADADGEGRFIATVAGFVDPAEYPKERLLTVTGRLKGAETRLVRPLVQPLAWPLVPSVASAPAGSASLTLETAVDRSVSYQPAECIGRREGTSTHPQGETATPLNARPARRLAALQLVGTERLFRLVVRAAAAIHRIDDPLSPCRTPRGTHLEGRPAPASRLTVQGGVRRWDVRSSGESIEGAAAEKVAARLCVRSIRAVSGRATPAGGEWLLLERRTGGGRFFANPS